MTTPSPFPNFKHATLGTSLVLACVFAFSGCSVVGFGIGALIDSSTPDYSTAPFDALELRDRVRVLNNDSTLSSGVYQGLEPLKASEYATRYEEFQRQSQTSLPSLGDTLVLRMGGQAIEYVFRGFRVRSIDVEPLTASSFNSVMIRSRLRTTKVERGSESTPLPYHFLDKLERRDGTQLNHLSVIKLKNVSSLPLNDALILKVDGEPRRLPVNDIVSMEQRHGNNAKRIGAGIGLVVDIIAIVVFPLEFNFNLSVPTIP